MKIPKSKSIELIDAKIIEFEKLLEKKKTPLTGVEYQTVWFSTRKLIAELFSEEEAAKFDKSVEKTRWTAEAFNTNLEIFQRHVEKCIGQLMAYRYEIENFWPSGEIEAKKGIKSETKTKKGLVPFISMSFHEEDSSVNGYFTGLLDALGIEYETGERYSKKSIPEKVKRRIKNCDLMIGIFARRNETKDGKYKTAEWLTRELGFADGAGKDIIALVEGGIEDIAGLKYEKEIIYFERDNAKEMQKATIKFIEALKEHLLV